MLRKILILSLVVFISSGCTSLGDVPRNIAGYSRRDMAAARGNASYQVYQASFANVLNLVLSIVNDASYYVFAKDEIHGYITVMHIPGVVDTTEVAIYLTPLANGQGIKVEIASRSTPAKRVVAAELFSKIKEKLGKV